MTYEERKEQWDRDYGRASGIPPCCIDFFVRTWLPMMWDAFGLMKHYDQPWLFRALQPMKDHNWGYVPCPGCRATGAKVVVKRCDPPYEQPTR